MSTPTPLSRIARNQPAPRPSIIAAFGAIVADALTTVHAMSVIGIGYERGLMASIIVEWLWRATHYQNLGDVAGLYAIGYVAVGGLCCVGLHLAGQNVSPRIGKRFVQPVWRRFPTAVTAVFAGSAAINLFVLAKYIAYVPDARWF